MHAVGLARDVGGSFEAATVLRALRVDRLVLGVDAKDGFVATEGWLEVSRTRAVDLARQVSDAPLAAVVYTDIAKDGMMSGPNFDALAEMQEAVPLP